MNDESNGQIGKHKGGLGIFITTVWTHMNLSLKSLFDIFGIVWFIIGNYFIFTSGQCAQSSPTLFYTTLVWILLGYGLVVVPLFLCISVIFCLPCVLGMFYGSGWKRKDDDDVIPTTSYI